jgi:hypothetical protein
VEATSDVAEGGIVEGDGVTGDCVAVVVGTGRGVEVVVVITRVSEVDVRVGVTTTFEVDVGVEVITEVVLELGLMPTVLSTLSILNGAKRTQQPLRLPEAALVGMCWPLTRKIRPRIPSAERY